MARILAIADAYESMTSERSYKKAFTKNEAIAELKKYSGIQFDPELVNLFINKVIKNLN
nr:MULTISPECIES: HD domain-containing phosphohydrolase [Clostridium]